MTIVLAPIMRKRLWRDRKAGRLFYYEREIYGNSAIMREVKKILPGIYRKNGTAWFIDRGMIQRFFERRGW